MVSVILFSIAGFYNGMYMEFTTYELLRARK